MYNKQNDSIRRNPGDLLYLLAWQDTLERLDTLLLEARHLQISLIHALREPVLYLPLRMEESYILGQQWTREYPHLRQPTALAVECIQEPPEKLADRWICGYPDSKEKPRKPRLRKGDHIREKIRKELQNIFFRGDWGDNQRRYYQLLRAIQIYKRQLLCDKIVLCREALGTRFVREAPNNDQPDHGGTRFIILRTAIHSKLSGHIEHIRHFQRAFGTDQDLGLQDHPRPSVGRRRELGIYSEFLADRTRDLNRDIALLLLEFTPAEFARTEIIFHRWRHDFTSRCSSFEDRVHLEDEYTEAKQEKINRKPTHTIRFVNTSYFMPERPDLQSVIAHEVAHGVIRDRYENFSDWAIESIRPTDQFGRLIVDLMDVYEKARTKYRFEKERYLSRESFREIACDFLATAVKGEAYVYALFLELIGHGLELMARRDGVERSDLDLDMALHPEAAPLHALHRRQWYIRLRLVTAWMRAIHHWKIEEKSLDNYLLEGVESLCDELNAHLNYLLPSDRKADGHLWEILADRLCWVVADSKAADKIKQWRRERSQDQFKEDGNPGTRKFPLAMTRLPFAVRRLLYQVQRGMKCEEGRPLFKYRESDPKDLDRRFKKFYSPSFPEKQDIYSTNETEIEFPKSLYRHLYDIPWQSALMRAMDLLWQERRKPLTSKEVLYDLHFEFPLGRELFQLALEFYKWYVESPLERLLAARHLIDPLIYGDNHLVGEVQLPKLDLELWQSLKQWHEAKQCTALGKDDKSAEKQTAINQLLELWSNSESLSSLSEHKTRFRELERVAGNKLNQMLEETSIDELLTLWMNLGNSSFFPEDKTKIRELERVADEKLKQLHTVLSEQTHHQTVLSSLRDYLEVRFKKNKKGEEKCKDNEECEYKYFYDLLTNALTSSRKPTNPKSNRSLHTHLLARISCAGAYKLFRNDNYPLNGGASNAYRLTDTKLLSGQRSYDHSNLGFPEHRYYLNPLVGRYDYILVGPTRTLCRCTLPYFGEDTHPPSDKEGIEKERYYTFFSRREMAFQVSLMTDYCWPTLQEPAAYLAIGLRRRNYRLDFLARLIRALKKTSIKSTSDLPTPNGIPPTLEQVAGTTLRSLSPYAYLTDGWGDLIIVFPDRKDVDCNSVTSLLSDIFHVQNAIFQDFMVDRTELIFTTRILSRLLRCTSSTKDNFQIEVDVRMMENHLSYPSNYLFEENGRRRFEEKIKSGKSVFKKVSVSKIPGNMDFGLRFSFGDEQPSDPTPYSLSDLFGVLDSPFLDRVDTSIGKRRYEVTSSVEAVVTQEQDI